MDAKDKLVSMLYRVLATATAIVHFAFILFVVLGGIIVLRWPRVAWVHVPAAVWGALIEFAGWYCPLTHLENYFLRKAGRAGYTEGFVAHYLFAIIYPSGLTRGFEIAIGLFVVVVNVTMYVRLIR
jgi:hypothetical protein